MPPFAADSVGPIPLAKKLAARIAARGPISFHDYMEACLYDPEVGYYRKRDPLGHGGDFITAPEISQVFGELIGLWAGETWRLMGEPGAVQLIELGPGRGTLMADALRALRVVPGFLKNVAIQLVESSEALRAAQAAALASVDCPVSWHDAIEEVPSGPSIIIANEFFDCLPVRQFVFDQATLLWRERMVTFGGEYFRFEPGASGHLSQFAEEEGLDAFEPEDGAILETRPALAGILQTFANRAGEAPFAALIVDYGYAKPSFGDTVQAVRQHRFAGVFDAPGETDLTAHVDFAGLVKCAASLGLKPFGPMPMGEWLLRLGLQARFNQLVEHASEESAKELRSRISRLADPAQMGALFKTVVLTGGSLGPLPPFA